MLKLFIGDTNATSGSVAVSWCIDEEVINKFVNRRTINPMIILCVVPENSTSKEYRIAVPLKDMMAYVSFRRPGKNKIFAFICDDDCPRRWLNKNSYYKYYYNVLTYGGEDYCSTLNEYERAEPLEVDVPAECFAPEPPEWEKAWVNALFKYKPEDQCDFRRRRIFAYTLQPVLFLLSMTIRFVWTLFALLAGFREFSFKVLFHPLAYGLIDLPEICGGGTIFVGRGKNKILNYLRLLLMPYVLGPIVLFFVLGAKGIIPLMTILKIIGYSIGGLAGAAVLVISLFYLIVYLIDKAGTWYLNKEEMEMILCNGEAKPTKISALPKRKQTIKLKFYDLKSKVCRPFSS